MFSESRLVQGYLAPGWMSRAAGLEPAPGGGRPAAGGALASHVAQAIGRHSPLQPKTAAPGAPVAPASLASGYVPLPFAPPPPSAFGTGGRLPNALRARAEDYFATDLGHVQLYSSPRLTPLGARAVTLGSRLIFAPGSYDPASAPGRALLAHELAHVVQQQRGRLPPPPRPGFFLVRDPRLEAEALIARHALERLGPPSLQPRRLPAPRLGAGRGVLQAARGDWYNDGRLEVREGHGTANRGDPAIYLRGGDNSAYVTYAFDDDGTTVIIPHFEALNFEGGHGIGWMLMRVLADHGLAEGRTHAKLGTAVYRNPNVTHGPTNAAVHIYEVLGFDVSSSQNVLASRVSLNQIRQRAVQNAQRYNWVGGRLPNVQTPLIQNTDDNTSCCLRCYLTTACVQHFGLPIDGEDLTVLRRFRDGFLSAAPSRRRHLERYYATAPEIVRRLAASPGRDDAYRWIYRTLRRCVGLLREGGETAAMGVYGRAVEALEARFLAGAAAELPEPERLFSE